MGIQIVKQADIEGTLDKKISNLHKEFNIAVSDEVTQMVRRTQSGRDKDNKSFKSYSPSYSKFKRKRGRNVSPPDLTFTGKMLGAITYKTFEQGTKFIGEIFFNSSREATKARGNLRHRQFFGFSKEQILKIQQRIKAAFK